MKSFKQILDQVADCYPMPKERILNLNLGRHEDTIARYAVYKIMLAEGYTVKEIAAAFGARPHNVAKKLRKYEDWLRIYPVMKANYYRLQNLIVPPFKNL
jgi:hypothetical protein